MRAGENRALVATTFTQGVRQRTGPATPGRQTSVPCRTRLPPPPLRLAEAAAEGAEAAGHGLGRGGVRNPYAAVRGRRPARPARAVPVRVLGRAGTAAGGAGVAVRGVRTAVWTGVTARGRPGGSHFGCRSARACCDPKASSLKDEKSCAETRKLVKPVCESIPLDHRPKRRRRCRAAE
jgi:hypothetical protein